VVHLFPHLVFRRSRDSNPRLRTMAQMVSPRHSPLDRGLPKFTWHFANKKVTFDLNGPLPWDVTQRVKHWLLVEVPLSGIHDDGGVNIVAGPVGTTLQKQWYQVLITIKVSLVSRTFYLRFCLFAIKKITPKFDQYLFSLAYWRFNEIIWLKNGPKMTVF